MSHLTFLEHLKSFDKDEFNSSVRLGSSFDSIITKEDMDEMILQDRLINPSNQLPEDLWSDAYRQIL